MISTLLRRTSHIAIPLIWGAGIVAALYSLQHYNSIAGQAVLCRTKLTDDDTQPDVGSATLNSSLQLEMYVHPFCPCTRASFEELTKIVDHARALGKDPTVKIIVVVAPGMPEGWQDGPNTQAAHRFPGAEVNYDLGARLAREHNATTSGYVVVVDSAARLGFYGGITRSRGHAGDNSGTRAVIEILHGRKPYFAYGAVYGCPLYDAEACASLEACSTPSAVKSVPQ